jgi:hypothetical protein
MRKSKEWKSGKSRSTKGLSVFAALYPQATKVLIDEENYFKFEVNPLQLLEKMV